MWIVDRKPTANRSQGQLPTLKCSSVNLELQCQQQRGQKYIYIYTRTRVNPACFSPTKEWKNADVFLIRPRQGRDDDNGSPYRRLVIAHV